jgi:hypothetical protein
MPHRLDQAPCTAVREYRCYLLDKSDRVLSSVVLEAEHDTDALLQASALLQRSDAFPNTEVWEGKRLVGRVPAAGPR